MSDAADSFDFRADAGEQFRGMPAEAWNGLMDMLRSYRRGGGQRGGRIPGGPEDSIVVLVKNTTGQTVPQFGVLGIDSPLVKPADSLATFRDRRAIVGITPAAGKPFVITQEPIAPSAIGRAVILGLTPVQLCLAVVGDQFAGPENNDMTQLYTWGGGPAQVLWADNCPGGSGSGSGCSSGSSGSSGSGAGLCSVWALVLLAGCDPGQDYIDVVTCVSLVATGSSGSG